MLINDDDGDDADDDDDDSDDGVDHDGDEAGGSGGSASLPCRRRWCSKGSWSAQPRMRRVTVSRVSDFCSRPQRIFLRRPLLNGSTTPHLCQRVSQLPPQLPTKSSILPKLDEEKVERTRKKFFRAALRVCEKISKNGAN